MIPQVLRSREGGGRRRVHDRQREVLERTRRRRARDQPRRAPARQARQAVADGDDDRCRAPGSPTTRRSRSRPRGRSVSSCRSPTIRHLIARYAERAADVIRLMHERARSPRAAGAVDADARRRSRLRHPARNGAQADRHRPAPDQRRRARPPRTTRPCTSARGSPRVELEWDAARTAEEVVGGESLLRDQSLDPVALAVRASGGAPTGSALATPASARTLATAA